VRLARSDPPSLSPFRHALTPSPFLLTGLEYYGECFYALAGESLSSASTPVDESLCRFSCRGAPYEDCGGKASLSLWKMADRVRRSLLSSCRGSGDRG